MKLFLFDVDDTLYNQLLPFENAYEQIFQNRHEIDIHRLYVASRKHGDDVFEASERGEMSMDDMHVYRISKAFLEFAVTITREEALQFQRAYEKAQKQIYLSDVMKELLTMLKERGERLGVITNGPGQHQRNKIKALELETWIPREYAYISGELGMMKPDKRIFEYAVSHMQADEAVVYYIGDSFANDIVGANHAGLKTVWMNRRNHTMPKMDVVPDYEVHTEEALRELLLSF